MIVGIAMFIVLILLQYSGSRSFIYFIIFNKFYLTINLDKFLVRPGDEKNVSGRISALLVAALVSTGLGSVYFEE